MSEAEIRTIVAQLIARHTKNEASAGQVRAEASARHVHLNQAAVETLFGPGTKLEQKRALSQTGEFLAAQRVRIVTPKGEFSNVAVLGPERKATQVEISRADCRALGVDAPCRISGDLSGAADVFLIGPCGVLHAKGSTIVAKAHIHLPPEEAQKRGLFDGQLVQVKLRGERTVTFEDIVVRVASSFTPALHLDLDEANACALAGEMYAEIFVPATGATVPLVQPCTTMLEGLITEQAARDAVKQYTQSEIKLAASAIVTPLAKDVFRQHGKTLYR